MGKRELVIISIFVVLGICVYQFTAPPPPPGSEDVSIGGIFNKLRRNIRGARETAPADWTQTTPVEADIRELRVNISRPNDLTITGENRDDLAIELHAVGRGYDEADAKAAAATGRLKVERAGDGLVVSIDQAPQRTLPHNARLDQVVIVLKVPQRLAIRLEPHFGRLIAANVAGAEIMGSRGETRITGVNGLLRLTHSGGRLEIEAARSLKLGARNSRGSIKQISGACSLDATGAELEVADVTGPFEAELRNTELTLNAGKALKPPLRINASSGRVRVEALRTEARIDGRNTDVDVAMDASVPLTIYNTGEDINVTAPPTGYTLDAVATEGRLDIGDGALKPQENGEARVNGAVRGGGPTISLRATRGNISVRKPEGK